MAAVEIDVEVLTSESVLVSGGRTQIADVTIQHNPGTRGQVLHFASSASSRRSHGPGDIFVRTTTEDLLLRVASPDQCGLSDLKEAPPKRGALSVRSGIATSVTSVAR